MQLPYFEDAALLDTGLPAFNSKPFLSRKFRVLQMLIRSQRQGLWRIQIELERQTCSMKFQGSAVDALFYGLLHTVSLALMYTRRRLGCAIAPASMYG